MRSRTAAGRSPTRGLVLAILGMFQGLFFFLYSHQYKVL
jgi:hypothetical protein